jgi:hypothetical protein
MAACASADGFIFLFADATPITGFDNGLGLKTMNAVLRYMPNVPGVPAELRH